MKKSNKGLTMIEIIIVIIILILLAVIAIWNTRTSTIKAEGTYIYSEFSQLYKGANMFMIFYNTGTLDELEEGVHYFDKYEDESGETWYTIYGQDVLLDRVWLEDYLAVKGMTEEEFINEQNKILETWSIDELKRSYDIKFGNDDIKIKYANNKYVVINNYKIKTFDELKVLQESGAF